MPEFGEHLEATITWTSSSVSYQSKLYYVEAGAGALTLDNIVQAADFVLAKIKVALREAIPPYVTLQPLVVRFRTSSVDIEDTSSEAGAVGLWSGAMTGPGLEDDVLPEGDQIVIQRRSSLAGRSKRGRIFLPFVPEELVDNSTINAAGLVIYKKIATKFAQTIEMEDLGTWSPVTKDYKNGVLVPVTHCRVVSEVCTRRDRRMPKRPVAFRAPEV